MKLEPVIFPLVPYQNTAPPLALAVLLSNVELIILPLVAPSCQSIAPPLTPAVLLMKWEFANVVLSQCPKSDDSRYTAPPLFGAVLFSNVQLSTRPFDPIQTIAPPSPPLLAAVLLFPVAWLLVKFEFNIFPSWPFQKIAPPALWAVLFSNTQLSIVPFVASSCQSTAPPLVPAMLFSKYELLNVLLSHSAIPLIPRKNTAPPWSLAVLLMKLQSSTVPFDPVHMIAPPSPWLPNSQATVPLALLLVKFEPLIIPPTPNQNIAPAFAAALLFSKVQFTIWPSVAPWCQSIAPPFIDAVLLMKLHLVKSLSCEFSR